MKLIPKRLLACTGALTLGAFELFAAGNVPNRSATQNRFLSQVETVLSMTPAQKDQAQMAFDEAKQAAQPVRQQLKETNQSLKAAIRSDNMDQIQRLSTAEGQEIGRLVTIRNTAVAKIYNSLTPDQRVKAEALQNMMMRSFRHAGAVIPSTKS